MSKAKRPRRPGGKSATPEYFAGRDDERAAVLRFLAEWEKAFGASGEGSLEAAEAAGALGYVRFLAEWEKAFGASGEGSLEAAGALGYVRSRIEALCHL